MKGVEVEVGGGDLHANDEIVFGEVADPTGYDPMDDEAMAVGNASIWLDRDTDELLDVDDDSIFYGDFPPLPDFPCMSSSSSSSSAPAPLKSLACSSSSSSASSSSTASWAVLKSDAEEDEDKKNHRRDHQHHDPVEAPPAALSSTGSMEIPREIPDQGLEDVDCMNVMENFGYMDLLEPNDIWDPSSLLHMDDSHDFEAEAEQQSLQEQPKPSPELPPPQQQNEELMVQTNDGGGGEGQKPSEDLAMVFFEWLKSNKESISPEDLRNIKLKRATIECAAKRLGGGKDGMKQLLKLILEWVQNHQLQKKRISETPTSHFPYNFQDPFPTQSPNPNTNPISNCNPIHPDHNPCFTSPHWLSQPPYMADPPLVMAPPPFPQMVGYMGDPFTSGPPNMNGHPYQQPTPEYHILDSTTSWPPHSQFSMPSAYSSFPDSNPPLAAPPQPPQAFAGYGSQFPYQYFPGNGERLARLGSSATKEARKKRMARQRRVFSHHHRHHNSHNQQQQSPISDQQTRSAGNEGCNSAVQANWVFWPPNGDASNSPTGAPDAQQPPQPPPAAVDRQAQNNPRQLAAERRQVGPSIP